MKNFSQESGNHSDEIQDKIEGYELHYTVRTVIFVLFRISLAIFPINISIVSLMQAYSFDQVAMVIKFVLIAILIIIWVFINVRATQQHKIKEHFYLGNAILIANLMHMGLYFLVYIWMNIFHPGPGSNDGYRFFMALSLIIPSVAGLIEYNMRNFSSDAFFIEFIDELGDNQSAMRILGLIFMIIGIYFMNFMY